MRVPRRSGLQVHTGQVRHRREPGQDVAHLVGPIGGTAVAERAGQLAHLLNHPPEGSVHATGTIARQIGLAQRLLQRLDLHGTGV